MKGSLKSHCLQVQDPGLHNLGGPPFQGCISKMKTAVQMKHVNTEVVDISSHLIHKQDFTAFTTFPYQCCGKKCVITLALLKY